MTETSYGFLPFLHGLDAVGMTAAIVLAVMSVGTWYVIAGKAWRAWQIRRHSADVAASFWNAATLSDAARVLGKLHDEPSARLALDAISAAQHHERNARAGARIADRATLDELITRTLRQRMLRETANLEGGLTALASVGATAPFVGLFGTVWGIYHALLGISAGGISTLDKVAGPVGEALIMTAAGLAVAIPAVLAYNALSRGNRVIIAELDGFAHDLLTFLSTGARVEPAALPGRAAPAVSAYAAGAAS